MTVANWLGILAWGAPAIAGISIFAWAECRRAKWGHTSSVLVAGGVVLIPVLVLVLGMTPAARIQAGETHKMSDTVLVAIVSGLGTFFGALAGGASVVYAQHLTSSRDQEAKAAALADRRKRSRISFQTRNLIRLQSSLSMYYQACFLSIHTYMSVEGIVVSQRPVFQEQSRTTAERILDEELRDLVIQFITPHRIHSDNVNELRDLYPKIQSRLGIVLRALLSE